MFAHFAGTFQGARRDHWSWFHSGPREENQAVAQAEGSSQASVAVVNVLNFL